MTCVEIIMYNDRLISMGQSSLCRSFLHWHHFRSLWLPVVVALVQLEDHNALDLKLAKTLCIAGVTSFARGMLLVFGSNKKTYLTISLVGSVMT